MTRWWSGSGQRSGSTCEGPPGREAVTGLSAARDVLAPCIGDDGVDYAALERHADFPALTKEIARADLSRAGRDEQLAFFLNAYNLLVLESVLERLRRKPRWRGNVSLPSRLRFFLLERHSIAGQSLSLYGLENRVIRAGFGEPRIHFALNCASRSCPPLSARLFVAEELDKDLDQLTRAFVNSREVRYDSAENTVVASRIFRWYRKDFAPGIVPFLRRYRDDVPPDTTVLYTDYDWRLNRGTGRQ